MNNTRRSLLIGVNSYTPAIGPLRFCASDAKRLESVLNTRRDGFAATESILLTDDQPDEQQPTRPHIIENIVRLCNAATNDDTLLLYFSGHGAIGKDDHLYLLPRDVIPVAIEQTALSWQWIQEQVEQSRARNKIIFIDACHSGAGKDVAASVRMSFKVVGELESSKGGFICLTSCSGGQLSYELLELEQSLFSYYLVNGITGAADPLGRGVIDVESLYAFVRDRTHYHAQQQLKVEQTPYLISKVSAPLNTFVISATNVERPINRVLVLTEDPLLGRFLETGIKLNPLAQDATWIADLEQAISDAQTRFEYDAVYLDVRNNLNLLKSSAWSRKKAFILLIRRKYPIVPFVLVGVPELFLQELGEKDRQRFEHYFFFDMRRPMTVASTLISDTLAQVEWDIRLSYGEQTSL